MKAELTFFLIFFVSTFPNKFVESFKGRNVRCNGSTVKDIRIQGCYEQPCRIQRGDRVPVEVDFSFTQPMGAANQVNFQVIIPYYATPPDAYGTPIIISSCDNEHNNGKLGFECPISANQTYTLRSSIFIDPQSRCTAGCAKMNRDGTGMRSTLWTWEIYNKSEKQEVERSVSTKEGHSVCSFKVTFKIVD